MIILNVNQIESVAGGCFCSCFYNGENYVPTFVGSVASQENCDMACGPGVSSRCPKEPDAPRKHRVVTMRVFPTPFSL